MSATTGPTPGTVIRRRHQVLAVIGGFQIVPPLNRICSVRDFPTLRIASFRLPFSNSVALEAKRILTALVKAILRILAAKGTDCRLRKQPREPVHTARDHAHGWQRLWKSAEVDHRVPLFRVWEEYRDVPWPKLLDFWGLPNLQVINRDVHAAKCAVEARDRRAARSIETEPG